MDSHQSLFDRSQYPEFDSDRAVLYHELGHVVTWYRLGEGIGRLKCCRSVDKQLMPHVTLWPRKGEFQQLYSSPEYAEPYAERLLAGEIAARRVLGKRTDQICSKNTPVDAGSDPLLSSFLRQADDREDIVKVLKLALINAQSGWRAWINERLTRAGAIVNENWSGIERIARKFESRLPTVGRSCVWTGGDMITEMERFNIHSAKRPAVEIVFKGDRGGFVTRIRRFCRRIGRNGILCRYVENPVREAGSDLI